MDSVVLSALKTAGVPLHSSKSAVLSRRPLAPARAVLHSALANALQRITGAFEKCSSPSEKQHISHDMLAAIAEYESLKRQLADAVIDALSSYERTPASVLFDGVPEMGVLRALGALRVSLPLCRLVHESLRGAISARVQTALTDGGVETSQLLKLLRWTALVVLPFATLALLPGAARLELQRSLRSQWWPDSALRRLGSEHFGVVIEAVRVQAAGAPQSDSGSPLDAATGGGDNSAAYSVFRETSRIRNGQLLPRFHTHIGPTVAAPGCEQLSDVLDGIAADLTVRVYACVLRFRAAQLFEIIRDYPESRPAAMDLAAAVAVLGAPARTLVSKTLVTALHSRLLHPGATTSDILQLFITALRVMQTVDPTGIVVVPVADAVRMYLRHHRSDTVRVIVQSLTEDVHSELHAELSRRRARIGNNVNSSVAPASSASAVGGGGVIEDDDADGGAVVVPLDADEHAPPSGVGSGWVAMNEVEEEGGQLVDENGAAIDDTSGVDIDDEAEDEEEAGGDGVPGRHRHTQNLSEASRQALLYAYLTTTDDGGVGGGGSHTALHTQSVIIPQTLVMLVLLRRMHTMGEKRGHAGPLSSHSSSGNGGGSVWDDAWSAPPGLVTSVLLPFLLPSVPRSSPAHTRTHPPPARPSTLWQPPPRERDGGQPHLGSDLLLALVSVFGSPESFIGEYRALLAERLLSKHGDDYDTEHDERTLELLKLRFGDDAVSSCEIMLRDIVDSKRVAKQLRSATAAAVPPAAMNVEGSSGSTDAPPPAVDVTIVSHHFWPAISKEKDRLLLPHPALQSLFDAFAKGYAGVRKPRHLELHASVGTVELEVDASNASSTAAAAALLVGSDAEGTVRGLQSGKRLLVTCSTPQASLLLSMKGRARVPVGTIAKELNVSTAKTLAVAAFWTMNGLLTLQRPPDSDSGNPISDGELLLCLCPTRPRSEASLAQSSFSSSAGGAGGVVGSGGVASSHALNNNNNAGGDDDEGTMEEAAAVHASYVLGMLSNLGPLPIDRIHNTLIMFASMGDHPYEKSTAELTRFLGSLVRNGKIASSPDGTYRVP